MSAAVDADDFVGQVERGSGDDDERKEVRRSERILQLTRSGEVLRLNLIPDMRTAQQDCSG